MRIFLGFFEICNTLATIAKGFRKLGIPTYTCLIKRNPYFPDSKYDMVLSKKGNRDIGNYFRLLFLFIYSIITCNVFVFTYYSFTPWFIDLPILKLLSKKIVFIFWGSDARSIDAFEKHMHSLGLGEEYASFIKGVRETGKEPLKNVVRRVKAADKYADLILSQPGYAQLQTRPYKRANIPLDLSLYRFNIPGRKEPMILHAPTNQATKGTTEILQAVRKLKKEGVKFNFRLVEGMPNHELRSLLSDADIVVDELYSDTLGVFSSEGMATGNAVLVHYPDFAGVPQPCPAINVNKDNLLENLRKAIVDIKWRKELAERGREYVEMHNDHMKIVKHILEWLNIETR